MHDYPELEMARKAMEKENDLYKPSSFWAQASSEMCEEFCREGVENFRSLPMPLDFFVPTYGNPGGGFSDEQSDGLKQWLIENIPTATKPQLGLEQFLSGYNQALGDYRVLKASDIPTQLPNLHNFSESKVGTPKEHFEFEGKFYSRSALNYLLGLAFLKKHLKGDVPKTVLEIGAGFGTLGEVLSQSGVEGVKYIDIDIPPTSFVAQYYLSKVLGADNVATFFKTKDEPIIYIEKLPMASVLCSWQIEKLVGKVDLFVNYISFQEMEPNIVENYCKHISRLKTKWVLLRNIREGKQLLTETNPYGVTTPILSDDYLKMLPDYELVDSSVIPYGYQTVDKYNSELQLFRRK
ncbi:MAG: putative sugar O-methyltransferase [Enterobacterales bacterium]|jgi:putative sugar O-methyltransferase